MNTTLHKMLMIWAIILVMGLLYACPDTVSGYNAPTLTAGDITYDKDRIAQGTADTATLTSSTISDFSGLIFDLKSISTHTGTQVLPIIAEDGTIETTTTTSAGSYRVTITPDGSVILGDPITVNFYVTVKPADIRALDTTLQQAVTDYGLTGDFNYIDTSDVTTMSHLFRSGYTPGTGAEDSTRTYIANFNGDISKWDVSAVTDFSYMFDGAAEFSQNLSGWSVSSTATINMFSMFKGSGVASLPDWYAPTSITAEDITYDKDRIVQGTADTATPTSSTISDFSGLIFDLKSISTHTGTQTLPSIAEEGGSITTTTTTSAGSYRVIITPDGSTVLGDPFTVDFYVTVKPVNIADLDVKLKQAITDYGLTGDFNYIDTSVVTDMSQLFQSGHVPGTGVADSTRTYIEKFNGDISKWDVSAVEDFGYMFYEAAIFNQDISGWNVSAGENFGYMFYEAAIFNQDIGRWKVSAGTNFKGMFNGAAMFNQNIGRWIVEKGENFGYMFEGAEAFNQDISGWKVSAGKFFINMFNGAKKFNQDISKWTVTAGTDFRSMFEGATAFAQDVSSWNLDPNIINITNMFLNSGVTNLPSWYTP